jgi:hypothetical protein
MKIWTAIKRLNQRWDASATRAANKMVDDLDRRRQDGSKPGVKKHISLWDLLPKRPDSSR